MNTIKTQRPIMPVTNQALLAQIHLSGEVPCAEFTPHPLRPNFCTACSKLVNRHTPEAIPNDECLLQAIAYSQKNEKVPSCILAVDKSLGLGGLFHGGFKAVMNVEFLKKESVTHIVNTAKGLEIFGPKYLAGVETARSDLHITFLELGWEDTTSWSIPDEDLVQCVRFIHTARRAGGSVLVHCAQGKSRSATAVIAYIMASDGKSFQAALQLVQSQRKMAEPNPAFRERLKDFEKSDVLKQLQSELAVHVSITD